jgi:hypothetical protein
VHHQRQNADRRQAGEACVDKLKVTDVDEVAKEDDLREFNFCVNGGLEDDNHVVIGRWSTEALIKNILRDRKLDKQRQ